MRPGSNTPSLPPISSPSTRDHASREGKAKSPKEKGKEGAVVVATVKVADPESDLERIMINNTRVKGKELEFYGSEQHILNTTLKSVVLENEEALETLQDTQIERCIAMRQQLRLGNEKRRQAVSEFDEGYKFTGKVSVQLAKIIETLRLKVPLTQMAELGTPVEVPTLYGINGHLANLLQQRPHRSQLEMMEQELNSVIQTLTHGRINVVPFVFTLHDMVHSDVLEYVVSTLEEKEPAYHALVRQVEQSEFDREEALKSGHIQRAQAQHIRTSELLEDLIELVRDRLNEVMMGTKDPVAFRNSFADFQSSISGAMDKFQTSKEKFRVDLLADVKVLKEDLVAKKADNERCMAEAKAWQDDSIRRLHENARKQDDVWQLVIDQVGELRSLGEERRGEVTTHMEMGEKEEERKLQYEEYVVTVNKHIRGLEECVRHSDAALQMVTHISKYFEDGIALVQEKKMEEILDDLMGTEQKRYYEAVRQYALVMGDLIDRKEKRLVGINKMIRSLQQEEEMTLEALDPDMASYEQQVKEFEEKKEGVMREIVKYKANLDEALHEFRETEALLEEQGMEFVPPSLELQQHQAQKRQQFLEKRRILVEAEQDELAQEHKEVKKQEARAKVEKEAVQKRHSKRAASPKAGEDPQNTTQPAASAQAAAVSDPGSPAKPPPTPPDAAANS